MKQKIQLTEAQETLLITLYCKALPNPIFHDQKAQEIIERVDYDFNQLKVPVQTVNTVRLRASRMDTYARNFLSEHPGATILHPGCGLDSRSLRLDNGSVNWYDLDLPDVIDLRRSLYQETGRYHMIGSAVTDLTWLDAIPSEGQPVMVIAEGLLMYLNETQVRGLVVALSERFPGCHLVCDVFSRMTASRVERHPSLKKTGAAIQWGIDDPEEIETWHPGIRLKEEWFFTQADEVDRFDILFRWAFKFAGLFSIARKAHRILYYTL